MQRTQIYLTSEEQAEIRQISIRTGTSQSALIRTAIDQYIAQNSQTVNPNQRMAAFGVWHNYDDFPDLQALRAEERYSQ